MAMNEREYEYKPKWWVIVLGIAMFGPAAILFGTKAAYNDRGLIINRVIELWPLGATIFYSVLAAASLGFVAICMFLLYLRLAYQHRIVIGPTGLVVPATRWSAHERVIAYRDIQGLSITTVSGERFLYIEHPDGRHTIVASMLPSKDDFEDICAFLAAKVDELRIAP